MLSFRVSNLAGSIECIREECGAVAKVLRVPGGGLSEALLTHFDFSHLEAHAEDVRVEPSLAY
jgi:hypothetical protein